MKTQIVYYAVEQNYLLFRNSNMCRSFTDIIGPVTHFKIRKNVLHFYLIADTQYEVLYCI